MEFVGFVGMSQTCSAPFTAHILIPYNAKLEFSKNTSKVTFSKNKSRHKNPTGDKNAYETGNWQNKILKEMI